MSIIPNYPTRTTILWRKEINKGKQYKEKRWWEKRLSDLALLEVVARLHYHHRMLHFIVTGDLELGVRYLRFRLNTMGIFVISAIRSGNPPVFERIGISPPNAYHFSPTHPLLSHFHSWTSKQGHAFTKQWFPTHHENQTPPKLWS